MRLHIVQYAAQAGEEPGNEAIYTIYMQATSMVSYHYAILGMEYCSSNN